MSTESPRLSVRFSRHARLRYEMRGGAMWPDRESVLEECVPIGVPDVVGKCRLHPPTGMILVVKNDVVVTVLQRFNLDLNDDHLKRCDGCELRWNPATDDTCPWCSGEEVED